MCCSLARGRLRCAGALHLPSPPVALGQVGVLELIGYIGSVALVEHRCGLCGVARRAVAHGGPPVASPCDLVQHEHASVIGCGGAVGVIEQPVLSGVVGDDFAVVSRALPAGIALYDGGVVVVDHASALLVHIGSCESGGAPHHGAVGAVHALAA